MAGKYKNGKERQSGFTLLLTLMAMLVLTCLIVQFQADSAVYARASRYRQNQLQCRYAAESALIIASKYIEDMLAESTPRVVHTETAENPQELDQKEEDSKQQDQQEQKEQKEESSESSSVSSLQESLKEFLQEDPGSVLDPNEWNQSDQSPAAVTTEQNRLPWQAMTRSTQVGPVQVEIQIYDENSRFPLNWVIQSPYLNKSNFAEDALNQLADELNIKPAASLRAYRRTKEMGGSLDIPSTMKTLRERNRTSGRSRAGRPGNQRNVSSQWHYQTRFMSKEEFYTREKQFRQSMASFAQTWQEQLAQSLPDDPLLQRSSEESFLEASTEREDRFADYLSCWGSEWININTAPPEVIYAAFSILGLTREMADAIVEYRNQTPFQRRNDLYNVAGIDRNTIRAIRSISKVTSDTFSVRIEARWGRASFRLCGGIFQDSKKNIKPFAVFLAVE